MESSESPNPPLASTGPEVSTNFRQEPCQEGSWHETCYFGAVTNCYRKILASQPSLWQNVYMEAYLTSAPVTPGLSASASMGGGQEHHMSRNKRHPQSTQAQSTQEQSTSLAVPEQSAVPQTAEKRSLNVARSANASNAPVDPNQPVRAALVRPAKGENPQRKRVFGYDNGEGGKVPVTAKIVVVNASGLESSYPKLAEVVKATPTASVADHKTAGADGKSIRRAFRAGYIRFQQ